LNSSDDEVEGEVSVTEIIIERDYSFGTMTRFDKTFPPQLASRIPQEDFEQTIDHINELFEEAEKMTCASCFESFCGCATFFTLYLCFEGRYSKVLKKLDTFLESENDSVYKREGLMWLNPLSNGFLYLQLVDLGKT